MKKVTGRLLIEKYRKGKCTPEEKILIETWFHQFQNKDAKDIGEDEWTEIEAEMWMTLKPHQIKKHTISPDKRWMVAASIFVIFGFFSIYKYNAFNKNTEKVEDVNPGRDRARLTLSNGQVVDLDKLALNTELVQDGARVKRTSNGQIIYEAIESSDNKAEKKYNEIATPRGGQFQVILPDGSKVWLNAQSSIKYPLAFSAGKREVELKGEAYFEVAKQFIKGSRQPFIVHTGTQTVKVLGTKFNVNSYANEPFVKTTLLEGKVDVINKGASQTVTLKVNEQSSLNNVTGELSFKQVDPAESMAWKNDAFIFNNTDLQTIMRQLERWYDVEVVDIQQFSNPTYNGKLSRTVPLSKVLHILELTSDLKFQIKGNRIIMVK